MSATTQVVRVGSSLWWDGNSWEVESLEGDGARLRRSDEVRVVGISALAHASRIES